MLRQIRVRQDQCIFQASLCQAGSVVRADQSESGRLRSQLRPVPVWTGNFTSDTSPSQAGSVRLTYQSKSTRLSYYLSETGRIHEPL